MSISSPGVYVVGLFTQVDKFTDQNTGEARFRVTVATGRSSYGIFLSQDAEYAMIKDCEFGQKVCIKARLYVGKNGGVGFSDGQVIDVE